MNEEIIQISVQKKIQIMVQKNLFSIAGENLSQIQNVKVIRIVVLHVD